MNRPAVFSLALLALLCTAAAGSAGAADRLERGFTNPPASARPHTWWHWIDGNITREGITADLEAMRSAGIGGAQIFNVDVGVPAGPVRFMSEEWQELIGHAIREADRLGIELCIHNCAGWSSSGGPWVEPEHAMQVLVWSELPLRGPARFAGSLPPPSARPELSPWTGGSPARPLTRLEHYRDAAVLALRTPSSYRLEGLPAKAGFNGFAGALPPSLPPTPPGAAVAVGDVVDLTSRLEPGGRLSWDVPPGEWTVLRIGHAPTGKTNHPSMPEGEGLECDKMSREALDRFWSGMMAAVLRRAGPLAGRSLNNALIDSYEVGNQNWTPRFREEFRRLRGYDLLPYLPVVTGRVVGSLEQSERFLWDFRRTIADLFAENYFGYFGELCRRHGLQFSTEPYGGPFDHLQVGGLADIPMGEFWIGGGAIETAKLAASAGHTRGRRIIGAEAFTSARPGWLDDPYAVKALGDLAFARGINRYIFHRYAHQPWRNLLPGMTMGPWGMQVERTQTWWEPGAAWMRSIARSQFLLQSGQFIADVCYLAGEEATGPDPGPGALRPELPPGYDSDRCDASGIRRMRVRDGRIILPDGMRYRLLVLPDSPWMTPEALRAVRDLVRAGGTVVGPKPLKSPSLSGYPACDEEVARIGAEVWGDCDGARVREHRYGRGRVYWGAPMPEVLAKLDAPPDFEYRSTPPGARIAWIHRSAEGAEIYFVSNQRYRTEDVACTFRVDGRAPELWHADTGRIEPAPAFEQSGGRTTVPLRLEPAGSVFVVFRRPLPSEHLLALPASGGASRPPAPEIEILRAFYEPADGRPGADVTARVRGLVAGGADSIPATNEVFGDPTPNVVKRLRVEYLVDGKPQARVAAENETLELLDRREELLPPAVEIARSGAEFVLTAWQAGDFRARTSRGRALHAVAPPPREVEVTGPWEVRFPPGWGAPERARFERCIPWNEHPDPGIRYFSGTAEYGIEIDVPPGFTGRGRAVLLDLGRVKNFAAVRVNGEEMGVLWKPPFRVDVSRVLRPGRNRVSVRVTNLWPNRLIGDERLSPTPQPPGPIGEWPDWLKEGRERPPDGRYTFTAWRFYTRDSPLLESGLLGPVLLRSAERLRLRPATQ